MNTGRITGQAQKEWTHNEALQSLELCLQPVIDGPPINTPPTGAAVGEQYIVGEGPSGAFEGFGGQVATWTEAGWLFTKPCDKFKVTDKRSGLTWAYEAGSWTAGISKVAEVHIGGRKVLGGQQPGISSPSGGQLVDQEARTAIAALLTALRQHGIIAT